MNNSGQVSVQLKLQLDDLKRQAAQAGKIINEGVKTNIPGSLTSASARQVEERLRRENDNRIRAANRAFRSRQSAASSIGGAGSVPPGFIPGLGGAGAAGGGGGAGGGALTLTQTPLMMFAQIGAALAGLRVAIGLVKYALNTLLAPIRAVAAAADAARKAYANSLSSGTPLNFSIQTSALAEVLGVGQDEVLNYAAAVEVLNKSMKYSIATFQETNRPLTMLGWSMKSLGASFEAMFAKIGADLAPALSQAADLIKNTIDAFTKSGVLNGLTWFTGVLIHLLNLIAGAVSLLAQGFELLGSVIVDSVQYFIRQIRNSIARVTGGTIDDSDPFKETKDKADILARTVEDLFRNRSDNKNLAPEPSAWSQRMPTSAWEKMGLVLGSAGANYTQQTANNTKRIADLMSEFIGKFTSPGYDPIGANLPAAP